MKTSKFFFSTLIAAAAMSANAWADDYTWDRTQDYSFTWDFSQANTKNGNTGVLGGTVTNTFATEEVTINEITKTVIKEGSSDGSYWEVNTNSFFYDSLQEVTSGAKTGTLTFSVDYFWTGKQWGENILHIGRNDTGVALGLSNGYISFATGTATDDQFSAAKTELRLNANAWNTITWTLTGDSWSVSLNGGEAVSGGNISDITWDANAAERNKYSIGIKAPGWNSGATGLNDSGCELANLSVVYEGIELSNANLVWAGGANGGIWDKSAASWEGGIAFADGDSVTFNTADATVTVSGTVDPGSISIEENTTFSGEGYTISAIRAVTVADGKTLTLSGAGALIVGEKLSLGSDSKLGGTGVVDLASAGTLNGSIDASADSWSGTIKLSGRTNLTNFSFDSYLTKNSKVEVTGLSGWLNPDGSATIGEIILTDSGSDSAFKVTNGSSNGTNEIKSKVSGSGMFEHYWNGGTGNVTTKFSGDISGWQGTFKHSSPKSNNLTFSGNAVVNPIAVGIAVTGGTLNISFEGETEGREMIYSGAISGTRAISIGTNGTLTFNGSYANTGTTTFSSGTTVWKAKNNNANTHHTFVVGRDAVLDLTQGSLFNSGAHVSNGRLTVQGKVVVANSNWDSKGSFGCLQHNSGTISLDGGEIEYTQTEEALRALNVTSNGGTVTANLNTTISFSGNPNGNAFVTDTGTLTFNTLGNISVTGGEKGIISGSGHMKKTGAGTLKLSGDNTYTGGTTISQGTLVAASEKALGDGNVTVESRATLSLGASAVTVKNLSGAGTINLADSKNTSATLTVISTEDTEFSGVVITSENYSTDTTTIGLVKDGSATLTLGSEDFGFLNSLTVEAGSVVISQANASPWRGDATITVDSGATLKVVAKNDALAFYANSYDLAPNSLVVDLSNVKGTGEDIVLDIIAAETITFNKAESKTLSSEDSVDYSQYVSFFGNEELLKTYVYQTWTLDGGVLSLTLAIPEPSLFGLLAGLGALTLVGTRRRRGKKA